MSITIDNFYTCQEVREGVKGSFNTGIKAFNPNSRALKQKYQLVLEQALNCGIGSDGSIEIRVVGESTDAVACSYKRIVSGDIMYIVIFRTEKKFLEVQDRWEYFLSLSK